MKSLIIKSYDKSVTSLVYVTVKVECVDNIFLDIEAIEYCFIMYFLKQNCALRMMHRYELRLENIAVKDSTPLNNMKFVHNKMSSHFLLKAMHIAKHVDIELHI
jgi:hypothetical protein